MSGRLNHNSPSRENASLELRIPLWGVFLFLVAGFLFIHYASLMVSSKCTFFAIGFQTKKIHSGSLTFCEIHSSFKSRLSDHWTSESLSGWKSKNRGTPKWMVYKENPIKMDDLGVPPFQETTILIYLMIFCCGERQKRVSFLLVPLHYRVITIPAEKPHLKQNSSISLRTSNFRSFPTDWLSIPKIWITLGMTLKSEWRLW